MYTCMHGCAYAVLLVCLRIYFCVAMFMLMLVSIVYHVCTNTYIWGNFLVYLHAYPYAQIPKWHTLCVYKYMCVSTMCMRVNIHNPSPITKPSPSTKSRLAQTPDSSLKGANTYCN